jgi:hypothetical protein
MRKRCRTRGWTWPPTKRQRCRLRRNHDCDHKGIKPEWFKFDESEADTLYPYSVLFKGKDVALEYFLMGAVTVGGSSAGIVLILMKMGV